ncbi:MAG: hypothetical protein XE04_0949 [Marinimicrobia bacterium 46_43]|nr:MAG: hypothetical protein XE04_0949 [Marinimicrobia bacterium 46_43]HBY17978.1 hypothetical protein [Candidatus Neomarinimicrobiota bacterium]
MTKDKMKFWLGLIALLGSFAVYFRTMAPTLSFWDCGEFIATSYIMGVPHPPGSPIFLLLGRIFTMLPLNPDIGWRMNLMSPIASAGAVLLLYLIIIQFSHFFTAKDQNGHKQWIVYLSAFIGAMTFAFTTSHWFNAVEAEVYALSTFFTAIVVWLVLKWHEADEQHAHGERYLILIAYLIGLAIGVHMLNLLALPFIALIIYFRHKEFKWGPLILLAAGTGLYFVIINTGIIRGTARLALLMGIDPAAISFPLAIAVILLIIYIAYLVMKSFLKNHAPAWKWTQIALIGLALITIGYSSYETIFIRSLKNPNIDENDPESVRQAVAYLEREQYGAITFDRTARWQESPNRNQYSGPWDFFWKYQVKKMYIRYFNWQFIGRTGDQLDPSKLWGIPFLVGWFGMFYHFMRDRNRALSVLALFFMTGLAIIIYLNQPDPQPRERDYSYVGSFFAFSIWIGLGVYGILNWVDKLKNKKVKSWLVPATAVILLLVLPVNMLRANYKEHNRHGNYVASDYAYNLLNTVAPNGIIFTNGDNDTFPLWYMQEVEKVRTDVRVVNLSLLNTPWYILQLKHNEPKLDIPLSDEQIQQMTVIPWKSRQMSIEVPKELNPQGEITWRMDPGFRDIGLRVQDQMIYILARAAAWERPVYFAVTVPDDNRIGLGEYLSMEGLAMRLHPKKVPHVDPDKIYENFTQKYRFRNLDNPDVYLNNNIKRLLQNYRTCAMQAVMAFLEKGEKEKARNLLDFLEAKIPEENIPIYHPELMLQMGRLYLETGDTSELLERVERYVSRDNLRYNEYFNAAQVYYMDLQDYEKAASVMENAYLLRPRDPQTVGMLALIYREAEKYDQALELLDRWLSDVAPGDPNALQMKEQILKLKEEQTKQE